MICVQISGGLGNQMLQYAAGKALSLYHGTGLLLDTYRLDNALFGANETPRSFELDLFPTCRNVSKIDYTPLNLFKIIPGALPHAYSLSRKSLLRIRGLRQVQCREIYQNSAFYSLPDDSYLIGHFVSEIFFSAYQEEIRKAFRFPEPQDALNRRLIASMKERESVAIHVRRADYLNAVNSSHFVTCGPDYYGAAIRIMEERLSAPHYYLFSDDVEWARANISLPAERCTVVTHNTGDKSYEDMRLMSCCRHNITANSTFSWWGGWLNLNSDKTIVIPRKWYKNYEGPLEEMIVPAGWVAL